MKKGYTITRWYPLAQTYLDGGFPVCSGRGEVVIEDNDSVVDVKFTVESADKIEAVKIIAHIQELVEGRSFKSKQSWIKKIQKRVASYFRRGH